MLGLGVQELLVIFLLCLILFGASRLPGLGSSLGRAVREFGRAVKEMAPQEGGVKRLEGKEG